MVARLSGISGVAVGVKRLWTGDYLVEGKAIIERKRVPDFLESLRSGRLFNQASRLAGLPLRSFLLLEGRPGEWQGAGVSREGIQGALVALAVGFGIPVLRSADEAESASLILYTARQLQAPAKAAIRRTGRRIRSKRALQVFLLTGLPGVGAARAKGLLDRFGSVEAVVCASEQALAEVGGIGNRTAQRIHWAVHEVAEPYPS